MDHSFNPIFAQRYGMVAAVLIHDFAYWTAKNRANGKHMHDGLCWTYNSANAFQVQYPYMSRSQIYGALKKMLNDGLIVKGDYNTDKWVHTPWYAITEKGYAVISECAVESEKRCNRRDSENQTVERLETEQSSFENCDNDVEDFERGRSKNATTYTYTHNTILNSTNTDDHLSNSNGMFEEAEEESACAGDEVNPFGEGEQRLNTDTIQAYAANQLTVMSPRAMEELNGFVDDLSEDIVRHAIDNALDQGVRKWAYVKSILNDYVAGGVRNVADAAACDERHRKKRKGSSGPGFDRSTSEGYVPLGANDRMI